MKTFFIVALPRSRTAWLANFLTYGDSFCFHDGIGYHGVEGLRSRMLTLPVKIAGSSDTCAMFFIDKILSVFPETKIIAVNRDVDEVSDSLKRCGLDDNASTDLMKMTFEKVINYAADIVIEYNDINKKAASLWEYITDTECDLNRLEMLKSMNIQITKETIEMIKNTASLIRGLN